MKQALQDVIAERQRQIDEEGFTPEKDDKWTQRELAKAGAAYALFGATGYDEQINLHGVPLWPWHQRWWKPTTTRRALVKAAALLLAEIERLDREPGIQINHAADDTYWVMIKDRNTEQMRQTGRLIKIKERPWRFYSNGDAYLPLSETQLQKIKERLEALNKND